MVLEYDQDVGHLHFKYACRLAIAVNVTGEQWRDMYVKYGEVMDYNIDEYGEYHQECEDSLCCGSTEDMWGELGGFYVDDEDGVVRRIIPGMHEFPFIGGDSILREEFALMDLVCVCYTIWYPNVRVDYDICAPFRLSDGKASVEYAPRRCDGELLACPLASQEEHLN